VYVAAKELAHRVHAANIKDAALRDQATRASKSVYQRVSKRSREGAQTRCREIRAC
jgi:hypothetical protein